MLREMRLAICEYACHLLDTGHIRGPQPIGEVKCNHYSPSSQERHWVISCDPKILFPSKIMKITNEIKDLKENRPFRPAGSNDMTSDLSTTSYRTVLGLASPVFSGQDYSRLQADLQHIQDILSDKPPDHRWGDYRHGGFTQFTRPSGHDPVDELYRFEHVQLCLSVTVRREDDARFIRAVDRAANELIEAFKPAFEEAFSRGAPQADPPVISWLVQDSTFLLQRRFQHLLEYLDVRFYFDFSDRLLRYVRSFILAGQQVPDPPEDRSILTLFDLIDAPTCRQQYERDSVGMSFSQLFSFFLFPSPLLYPPPRHSIPRTGDPQMRAKPEYFPTFFFLQSIKIPSSSHRHLISSIPVHNISSFPSNRREE